MPPIVEIPKLLETNGQDGKDIVSRVRSKWNVTRKIFARLARYSERAIADWESGTGKTIKDDVRARMVELQHLYDGLATLMPAEKIGDWLVTPLKAFEGLKPLEVVERGHTHRLWEMIYLIRKGQPL